MRSKKIQWNFDGLQTAKETKVFDNGKIAVYEYLRRDAKPTRKTIRRVVCLYDDTSFSVGYHKSADRIFILTNGHAYTYFAEIEVDGMPYRQRSGGGSLDVGDCNIVPPYLSTAYRLRRGSELLCITENPWNDKNFVPHKWGSVELVI